MSEPLPLFDTPPAPYVPPRLDTPLMTVLRTMDRLNAFARAGYDAHPPKRWIYLLKAEALKRAHAAGLAVCRQIAVQVPCRDCGGRGRYTDASGCEHPHCRACGSTGTATLRFVETTLGNELRWHSPWSGYPVPFAGDTTEVRVTDWQPNQPGRSLPPEEVAGLLCAVEAVCWPRHTEHWDRDGGRWDLSQYPLHLGPTDLTQCPFCQRTAGVDRAVLPGL